ncbi:hypothetical protein ACTXNE_10720 [Psychrobacter namhaensis]|uniref:hypothetical protein n=1 Tax=Psychrobacter namhaensis TaxID=292734 RepID=UPI003FD4C3E4
MTKLVSALLIFLYLYPFSLSQFPALSSRTLLVALGFIILSLKTLSKLSNHMLRVNKGLVKIIVLCLAISFISLITVLTQNTDDFQFIKYPIIIFTGFLAAYFIIYFMKLNSLTSELLFIKLIIYAIALQNIISLLTFFSPPFENFLYSLVSLTLDRASDMEKFEGRRIVGFSRSFFTAGIFNGVGLILIAYCASYFKLRSKDFYTLILLYILLFLIGMMMARTTIIGAIFSIVMLFLTRKNYHSFDKLSYKKTKFLLSLVFLPAILFGSAIVIFPKILDILNNLINFAFEMFINFSETGSFQTSSTRGMFEMYKFPESYKTWFIGDGYWFDPSGLGYYQFTDIGYSRLIYYFGLSGLLIYITYQYLFIKQTFKDKTPALIFFLYFLTLNLKGFADLSILLSLLYLHKLNTSKN